MHCSTAEAMGATAAVFISRWQVDGGCARLRLPYALDACSQDAVEGGWGLNAGHTVPYATVRYGRVQTAAGSYRSKMGGAQVVLPSEARCCRLFVR